MINLLALRNHQSKQVKYDFSGVRVIEFDYNHENGWNFFPEKIIHFLRNGKIDLIIKFDHGLLKLDPELEKIKIFSFHHGDPRKYRGRPAGFYEILNEEKTCGIVVQSISNKIDSGKIYALAKSRIGNYSYKKTSINFYLASKFLLRRAIINFKNG